MRKILRALINLFTIALLLLGAYQLHTIDMKIFQTAAQLLDLNSNIRIYNELVIKTDDSTKEVKRHFEARDEIYQSNDPTIKWFSNQKAIVKIIIILLAIVSYPLMLLMIGIYIYRMTILIKTKRKRANYQRGISY